MRERYHREIISEGQGCHLMKKNRGYVYSSMKGSHWASCGVRQNNRGVIMIVLDTL